MILLARALVRLLSLLLLILLALAGLGLAVFCIDTGTSGQSLGHLAALLHLDTFAGTVGSWLDQLEAGGPVAAVAALCGFGAMLLGLLLLAGVLVPRRERLVTLTADPDGTLAARRRPLAQAAQSLVEQTRGVSDAKARVRPRRRTGGRLRIRATRPRPAQADAVHSAIVEQLRELTEPFELKASVAVGRDGERVQ